MAGRPSFDPALVLAATLSMGALAGPLADATSTRARMLALALGAAAALVIAARVVWTRRLAARVSTRMREVLAYGAGAALLLGGLGAALYASQSGVETACGASACVSTLDSLVHVHVTVAVAVALAGLGFVATALLGRPGASGSP